eukprot:540531-Alexandrium_andersonii.AAC.1
MCARKSSRCSAAERSQCIMHCSVIPGAPPCRRTSTKDVLTRQLLLVVPRYPVVLCACAWAWA